MAGYILHEGATVLCKHPPGSASPDDTDKRVEVSGHAVMTIGRSSTVSACALNGTNSPPCTTAMWVKGASRVFAGGLPVAIDSGESLCVPSGGPLDPKLFQMRVRAR